MSKRRPKQTPSPAVAPARRSKRTVVAALVLIAVAGTAAALWFTRRPPVRGLPQQRHQNVLLITIDTLRAMRSARMAAARRRRIWTAWPRRACASRSPTRTRRHASLAHEHPVGPDPSSTACATTPATGSASR